MTALQVALLLLLGTPEEEDFFKGHDPKAGKPFVLALTDRQRRDLADAERGRDQHVPPHRRVRTRLRDVRAFATNPEGSGDMLVFGADGKCVGVRGENFVGDLETEVAIDFPHDPLQVLHKPRGWLLFACADGIVRERLWGKKVDARAFPSDPMWAEPGLARIAAHIDGRWLVTAGRSGTIRIYDRGSGEERRPVRPGRGPLRDVVLTLDDTRAVALSESGWVVSAAVDEPEAVRAIEAGAEALSLAMGLGGTVWVGFADGSSRGYEATSLKEVARHPAAGIAADFLRFGVLRFERPLLLAGSRGGALRLLDAANGSVIATMSAAPARLAQVEMDAMCNLVTALDSDGAVHQWSPRKLADGGLDEQAFELRVFDPGDYDDPAARLGLRTTKDREGRIVVRYVLPGFVAPDRPYLNRVVLTEIRRGEKWEPLRDPASQLPERGGDVEVRIAEPEPQPILLRLHTAEEVASIRDRVARLLEEAQGPRLGCRLFEDGRVCRVLDGAPAAEAGLRVGDRILRIDGKPWKEARVDLRRRVRQGEALKAVVSRDGKEVEIFLVPGPSPIDGPAVAMGALRWLAAAGRGDPPKGAPARQRLEHACLEVTTIAAFGGSEVTLHAVALDVEDLGLQPWFQERYVEALLKVGAAGRALRELYHYDPEDPRFEELRDRAREAPDRKMAAPELSPPAEF